MSREPEAKDTACVDAGRPAGRHESAASPASSDEAGIVSLAERPGGRKWIARADSVDLARKIALLLDKIETDEHCTIIKKNMVRAVYRLQVAGRDLIVKHFYRRSIRDTLKHLVVPDKSVVEWRAAERLSAAGVSVPRMLARGGKRRGLLFQDACIVMEEIEGGTHAWTLIPPPEQETNLQRRRKVLDDLAGICALMHRHRIFHSDFHGGNILASEDANGNFRLHVVDLHSVKFPFFFRYGHRVTTLMYIDDALRDSAAPDEIESIFRRYARSAGIEGTRFKRFRKDVMRAAKRRQQERMKSRTKRCVKNSSRFVVEKRGDIIRRQRAIPRDDVLAAVAEHKRHAADDDDMVVHRSRYDTVTRTASGWCVKEWRSRGLTDSLRRLFGSKARAAWIAANGLRVRQVETPEPLAMVDERRLGGSCYLITRFMENARPLNALANELAQQPQSVEEQKQLAHAVADAVAKMHSKGVHHHDLSTKNLLVAKTENGWKVRIVDLDNVRFWRKLTRRRRLKALSQLNDLPQGISPAARLAFIRRYNAAQSYKLARTDTEAIARLTQKRTEARDLRPPE